MSVPTKYGPEVIDAIVDQLAEGKSLVTICNQDGMPDRVQVWRWMRRDDEIAERLLEAREIGFQFRAEMAVAAAKRATDPIAGRLAFDAERWYLGKLSRAFADKPLAIGVSVNVAGDDAFAAVAGALDRAAAAISSGRNSTSAVVIEGEARPADPAGQLVDLAGAGGPGLGEDPDGS
jgi:hypothetical protein